jgi:DNA-binding helix-hairpin-helix protein with protein kinase domain
MFQSQPNTADREAQAARIVSSVFKEIVHSAGVVVGGVLISAFLVSREGRNLKQH